MPVSVFRVFAVFVCLWTTVVLVAEERWVASWQRGQPADNLELFFSGDGITEEIEVEGRECIRTRGLYIYFKVPDSYAYELDVDMTLRVEIFDEAAGHIGLQYDAVTSKGRSSYLDSNVSSTVGDGKWKTLAFEMPGAWLANGENQGADFRICFNSKLPVRRVSLSVDSLEDDVYTSAADRRQALRDLRLKREGRVTEQVLQAWSAGKQRVDELGATLSSESRAFVQPLLQAATESVERLRETSKSAVKFDDDGKLRQHLSALREDSELVKNCTFLLERKSAARDFVRRTGKAQKSWVYFTQPAIDNSTVVLPWTLPAESAVNAPIGLQICRGEFEPYGLGMLSLGVVRQVKVQATDLQGAGDAVLPAKSVDIRVMKRWYQAGHYSEVQSGRELVPELLLYNDALVKADLIHQKNVLNFTGAPKDATTLQAFDLEPLYTKFLWVTVRAPDDAASGVYRGAIRISGTGVRDLVVPLRVEVLPFELEENPKIASMYYGHSVGGKQGADLERYRRQLINMREHGLTNPAFQGDRRELALRKELRLNQGPLLTHSGFNIGKYMGRDNYTDAEVAELKAVVDRFNALAEEFGYDGAYLYAIDEASAETLAAEVPVFRLLERLGGGAWAACLSDFEEIAAKDLQLPVYCGFPRKELVDKVHAAGHKIMRYASPQGGTEDPWQYRYYYGLVLWELNMDGGCTYTYQSSVGNPWDDFDGNGTYRDFMMTYPGADGPIDTVQWEGYREGNDDLRYMATLEKALEDAKSRGKNVTAVASVEEWFREAREHRTFHGENLDAVRERIVASILTVRRGVDD